MLWIISLLICLWIIFFNGAKVLENTVLGYFEFGPLGGKSQYIEILAWFGVVVSVWLLVEEFVS